MHTTLHPHRGRESRPGAGLVALAAILFCAALAAPHAAPAGELVPAYARTVLPNGLVVLLLEQHEVPVVDFQFLVSSGSIADPPGKEGLADLAVSLVRKGTDRYTAEQIADELDFLGGTLDLNASFERCSVSAQFLAKDVDRGLALLAEILQHPKFDDAEVKKLVALNVDGLRDMKDNPRQVIGPYYDAFLFQGHPFGRPVGGSEISLPTITRSDVVDWYGRNVRPNATILAVAGDFATDAMRDKLAAAFGGWAKGDLKPAVAPAPKPVKGRKVLLVDKPDATQTYFRIGNVGVARGNPDEAALDVVNTVFGGRFTSWLMRELRTKAGLTYNAHSTFVERRVPGAFYISSFTRTDDTGKAVDLALDILGRLHAKGLSDAELQSARNYIRGQFPPDFETTGQLAGAMADLEFFGFDRSYINQHTQRTDAVTAAEAKRVTAAHYPQKDMVLVMVGQAAKVRKTAAKYGPVTEKSVSQPGF
jgi:predicted Zn-dependent peptidase